MTESNGGKHENSEFILAIGLMSGTSIDGVDAAAIVTNGIDIQSFEATIYVPYDNDTRTLIEMSTKKQGDDAKTEHVLTVFHGDVVNKLLPKLSGERPVNIIGFHGQTIRHQPSLHITTQLGNGSLLADLTNIDVINDFRRRDVAGNGQGAPLVPVYHAALARKFCHSNEKVVFVNIGGVGNVTYIGRNRSTDILAFDTGPGNGLIDDYISKISKNNNRFDKDGELASLGNANNDLVSKWLSGHSYFDLKPPKSLCRSDFNLEELLKQNPDDGLSDHDIIASLTMLTAKSIAHSASFFPSTIDTWFICGGGRHNQTLMKYLQTILGENKVKKVDDLGIDGDMIEAQAFAYLAVRSLRSLPISLPTTTGCKKPLTGGCLHRANTIISPD